MPNLGKKNWKDSLPSIYSWLLQVKLECGSKNDAEVSILLAEQDKKDKSLTHFFAKSIDSSITTQITKLRSNYGIQNKSGAKFFALQDKGVVLTQITGLNVSAVRKAQKAGLESAAALKDIKSKTLAIYHSDNYSALDTFYGFVQGSYSCDGFKQKSDESSLQLPQKICFIGADFSSSEMQKIRDLLQSTIITRFIEDAPPNWLNPPLFAEIAQDLTKDKSRIKCTVKSGEEIKEMGMGSFYSVGQGSAVPAQFIIMEIAGQNKDKTVGLIGKGVTFDAGGISLKPSLNMGEMKYDMCGAGAVLGAALYLAQHPPLSNVVCLIGAVENLIGEKASKPADIVTSLSGKTIEILNTDAEGRLVLADLLTYCQKNYKPNLMIDIATLTGAVLIALGSCGSAILGNDQKALDYVKSCADAMGEPLWQLPIWPELPGEVKSEIADLKNIASPSVNAGTLIGAAFLQEFIIDNTPWVHLDVAATAWNCKATGHPSTGASAFALKTLIHSSASFE